MVLQEGDREGLGAANSCRGAGLAESGAGTGTGSGAGAGSGIRNGYRNPEPVPESDPVPAPDSVSEVRDITCG